MTAISATLRPRVLLLDDDEAFLRRLAAVLSQHGIECLQETIFASLSTQLLQYPIDVVVSSTTLASAPAGQVVEVVKDVRPLCQVVLLAGRSRVHHLIELLETGASDFATRPASDFAPLLEIISHAVRRAERWRRELLCSAAPEARP